MFHKQAFLPEEYDRGIVATLPYYEEYFKQIIGIVNTNFHMPITWLFLFKHYTFNCRNISSMFRLP